jgi:hypothetical protein
MKTKTLGWIVGLGAMACSFMACSQPKIECQVALAGSGVPYIAKFTVKGTPPACAMNSPVLRDGDLIGMEYYHPATADGTTYDSTKSTMALQADSLGNEVGTYASGGDVDICAPTGGCLKDADCGDAMAMMKCISNFCVANTCTEPHHMYGLGAFTSSTPDETTGMCSAPTVAKAEIDLPEAIDGTDVDATMACTADADCQVLMDPMDPMSGDPASGAICDDTAKKCVAGCRATDAMGMPATNSCRGPFGCTSTDATKGDCKLPADHTTYDWGSIDILVNAAAQGTQFKSTLKLTEAYDGAEPCSVEYDVVGMWPAVTCNKIVCTDPKDPSTCNPTDAPDDDFCSPCSDPTNPDPAKVRAIGSGINPNFQTKCEKIAGGYYCVLQSAFGTVLDQPVKDCGSIQ